VSIVLAVGHFVVPFFFLMPQTIKRRVPLLVGGALWILAVHLVDLYWLVMPTLHPDGPRLGLLDVTTLLGVGGLYFGAVGWLVTRQPLVPTGDPRLAESVSFENV
jgi:hypothetical protein